MNKSINTPETVQDLFRTAREVGRSPSELIELIDDVLGEGWWNREPEVLTISSVEVHLGTDERWDPHVNEWQRPAPGIVPPDFEPLDEGWDIFVGKSMDGDRWTIKSEWVLHTKEFSLTFWAHDDNPMTADETRGYGKALLEMSSYLSSMEAAVAKGAEAGK